MAPLLSKNGKRKKKFWSKFTLFEKSNCPKIQFWPNPNIFTSSSPNFFLTIFLVKSKLSTAKKSKTTTFSRNHIKIFFSGNQSWNFGQKMKISNSVKKDVLEILLHLSEVFLHKPSASFELVHNLVSVLRLAQNRQQFLLDI